MNKIQDTKRNTNENISKDTSEINKRKECHEDNEQQTNKRTEHRLFEMNTMFDDC